MLDFRFQQLSSWRISTMQIQKFSTYKDNKIVFYYTVNFFTLFYCSCFIFFLWILMTILTDQNQITFTIIASLLKKKLLVKCLLVLYCCFIGEAQIEHSSSESSSDNVKRARAEQGIVELREQTSKIFGVKEQSSPCD